ncbi:MAG: hypothetical protein ACTSRI_18475 [Promethearchaeota archaeon]
MMVKLLDIIIFVFEDDIAWSESLYMIPKKRRMGVGSALYEKGEVLVNELGGDILYN